MSSERRSKLLKVVGGGVMPGVISYLYEFGEFNLVLRGLRRERGPRRSIRQYPLVSRRLKIELVGADADQKPRETPHRENRHEKPLLITHGLLPFREILPVIRFSSAGCLC